MVVSIQIEARNGQLFISDATILFSHYLAKFQSDKQYQVYDQHTRTSQI